MVNLSAEDTAFLNGLLDSASSAAEPAALPMDSSLSDKMIIAHDYEDFSAVLANATEEQRKLMIAALHPHIEVTDVLPPPNHDDNSVQVMAVGYMLLFLLGTCGNVAVLTTIYQMVRSRRANLDNTLIYMIVLSCVDFGVCLSLPFTVIDQILGFWMFGSTMCKLHAVLENFGKILSALIISAMSFDRFAGVCHADKRVLRSRRLAICILIGMAVYALVALCPLLLNFTAREVILFQKMTGPNKVTRMRIEKCTMKDLQAVQFTMFTCFLFVLCYLVPLFLVTFFYTKLLSKLHHHARQFKTSQIRSQIPLMRISLYTLAVACFYFICWTPFWVATAFAVYLEYAGEPDGQVAPVFVYFMYFIHALPFTNSAVNWILYGALNGQLQQRVRHGTVHGGHGAGGMTSLSVAIGRTQNGDFDRNTMLNGHLGNHHVLSTPSTGKDANSGYFSGSANTTLLKSMILNGPGSIIPRHTGSVDISSSTTGGATIRPILSGVLQTTHCPQNSSSTCSLPQMSKERRPSCPGIGQSKGADGTGEHPLLDMHRYRRRLSGRQINEKAEKGGEGRRTKLNEAVLGDRQSCGEGEASNQQQELCNKWENAEELSEHESHALLLHSTDSVDCLLRIDSQSTTFL